ncbi:MAG: bifunctional acetate--CoA ligase family protein/GNAT family N-acetyltransferase [Alphaproteobacteria bacterium]|nr:bifunctional acetate--CoA ligase family protein/GNAT family N-acetyltransferase [Alphaproteobacteria bacterium]
MSIRNLDAVFRPRSVALIGASNRPNSVGHVVARNLLEGGFEGPVMPVSTTHSSVAGVLAYQDVGHLPLSPDLAIICTPPQTVPGIVADLAARGTKGAVVISAGFNELGTEAGKALEQKMLEAAKTSLLRIVGPNCLGVISTGVRLNASFAPVSSPAGGVAFVAQSGAMLTTILDWSAARGIGFSHLVSLGDMTDVDFGDMLDYLALDANTHSILLYIETITNARKFLSAARTAARLKPVIAIKAGRHEAAAKAASSHTGAMAGVDAVYDAAFRRAGILRVNDLDEVFDAVETLARPIKLASDRLFILTNGGGLGVMATDALIDHGGTLSSLTPQLNDELNKILPATWSHGNPIDIIGDAGPERYEAALRCLLEAPGSDAVLVLNCPVAVASSVDAAHAVARAAQVGRKPVFASWLGSAQREQVHGIFSDAGIPAYDTPDKAIRGFSYLVGYQRGQKTLMEVPPSLPEHFSPDEGSARQIALRALKEHAEGWLPENEIHAIFDCYGIPHVRSKAVASAQEAGQLAAEWGVPVALKILSPDITHKSDAGGVALGLSGEPMVRNAAQAMQNRIAQALPTARLQGFTVQEMIRRPGAIELIIGMAVDRQFGPFLLFGRGGTAAEVINDRAIMLPPLNLTLAREMMSRTRVWRRLQGYRDVAPADIDAIALCLVRLSQLIADIPQIAELDINPLLADAKGILALDARVRLQKAAEGTARFAILPYPKELEKQETVDGFGSLLLRPIRPEDAPAVQDLFAQLTPEDVRLRFFTPMRQIPPALLARLTQIDYDREMAFLLVQPADGTVLGASRYSADPDNISCEFAISVRSNLKGHGLGKLLMERLISYAKARGTQQMTGEVLEENERMLSLCRELGFSLTPSVGERGVIRANLNLI